MLEYYQFGAADIWLLPSGVAVPRPVRIGTSQDASVDFSSSTKMLQGRNRLPAAIADGALKISGKVKAAKFSLADLNSALLGAYGGGTSSTSTTQVSRDEGFPTGTAIPAAVTLNTSASTSSGSTLPFTATTGVAAGVSVSGANIAAGTTVLSLTSTSVTLSQAITGAVASGAAIVFGPSITVVNAATFVEDLGVMNAVTGVQMTPVASAPATGQYAVANGVYVFAVADVGKFVLPSYAFTQPTSGVTLPLYNQPMGVGLRFKMVFSSVLYTNAQTAAGTVLTLNNVGFEKFSLDFKNEDWVVPELDFNVADALGGWGSWSAPV